MATSKKTNPAPQVLETKVHPGTIFSIALGHFVNAREAALLAAYSVTCYLLCVHHFRKADDKEYRTVSDAVEYFKKELAKQTPVKGGMLDRYVNTGRELYSKLVAGNMFLPLLQRMGSLDDKTAGEMPEILRDYLAENTKIKSLSDLMVTLGYSTGHKKPGQSAGGVKPSDAPAKAATSVKSMIAKAAEAKGADGTKAELAVAREVANTFQSPVILARQAIERIANPAELKALADFITAHIDSLNRLAAKAQEAISQTPPNKTKVARPRKTAKPGRESVTNA